MKKKTSHVFFLILELALDLVRSIAQASGQVIKLYKNMEVRFLLESSLI